MQPSNVISIGDRLDAGQPLQAQKQRNRRRSACVPQTEATRLALLSAWLDGSAETTLAESTGTMRANIESALRSTVLAYAPELGPKIKRMRQALQTRKAA
jgi:hypothetical protein